MDTNISFKNFLYSYDKEFKEKKWSELSNKFKSIWNEKIFKGIADKSDFDDIVKILDVNAKGSKKGNEAVAFTFIRYGTWYRMLNDLNKVTILRETLNNIFISNDYSEISILIDKLYKENEDRSNGLTGKYGTALNAMLAANNPSFFVSSVSLRHRFDIINYFKLQDISKYDKLSYGKKLIETNIDIINGFKENFINKKQQNEISPYILPRLISDFFYTKDIKAAIWKSDIVNKSINAKIKTYLLTWNPKRWIWSDLQDCINEIEKTGWQEIRWSCGTSRRINRGDRVFLMRLGLEPKGIIASGWVNSECYDDIHWDEELANQGKKSIYVACNFNILLDAGNESILTIDYLKKQISNQFNWNPQMSGVSIPDDLTIEIEKHWSEFITTHPRLKNLILGENQDFNNDEIDEDERYNEGSLKLVSVNVYERNKDARNKCIKYYGLNCSVCGFNFESVYGNFGRDYIHVHHLKPLAEIGKQYELNPIEDLRPVCPNCHAIIHRFKPSLSIEELRKRIKKQHFV